MIHKKKGTIVSIMHYIEVKKCKEYQCVSNAIY